MNLQPLLLLKKVIASASFLYTSKNRQIKRAILKTENELPTGEEVVACLDILDAFIAKIQTEKVGINTQIDYANLSEVLPNKKLIPSDIDGVIEINDHFLFLECKFPDASIKEGSGQDIMLRNLSKRDRITCVVVNIEVHPTSINGMFHFVPFKWYFIKNGKPEERKLGNLQSFKEDYIKWYETTT